jgi:hypothetical protein
VVFIRIGPICVVFKDRFAFCSIDDDLMQGTWGIYAGFAGHGGFIQITELL